MRTCNNKTINKKSETTKMVNGVSIIITYMLIAYLATGSICFVRSTVGLPCPGCGLTRAYESLLVLDFTAAFFYHPLFWLMPILLGLYLYKRIIYGTNKVRWFECFSIASIVIIIGLYIVRMILYFPHTVPMTINKDAFLQRFIILIRNVFLKLSSS